MSNLQSLRQFLTNCFQAAHDKELTSIAIPAIGTGQLSFPRHIVATVMLDELCKFSSRNPQTPLRDVRFVVYQKDELIIKVSIWCVHIQSRLVITRWSGSTILDRVVSEAR